MRPHLLLGLVLALATAGCGFHPLNTPRADAQLPDIFVNTIPEGRDGQLLRQALQQRLAGSSEASPQGYTLQVSYIPSVEAIGIHGDNTSSRTRVVGRAEWTLASVSPAPKVLATGSARTVDGYNVIEAQYFAQTLAGENHLRPGHRQPGRRDPAAARSLVRGTPRGRGPRCSRGQRGTGAGAGLGGAARAPQRGFLGPQDVPGDTDQSPLQQLGPDGLPAGAIGRTYQ